MKLALGLALGALMAGGMAKATATETEIVVKGLSGQLAGTLATPEGAPNPPVVLVIPGSGPTDRNGDSPYGVKAQTYRLLAGALAERGVATARIDKRGMFASASAGDPNKVTIGAYADDVHAWVDGLKVRAGAPCVWLLGHSEGGLVALEAAQRPDGICGLVLVAAAGRPLGEIVAEQLKANPANAALLPQAMAALASLEAGKHVDVAGMDPALLPLFRPAVQDFLIEEMSYDPARLLAAFPGPVLVVQGDADLQVSLGDARRLAAARPGVRLVIVPGANHVLKTAPLDRAANIATYADPALPLAPGVADAIASFVKSGGKEG